MHFFVKLFCRHKWISHAKNIHMIATLKHSGRDIQKEAVTNTTEIIFCTNCGKVKKIKY